MLFKYGNCTCLLKIKNQLKIGCSYKSERILDILWVFLIKQRSFTRAGWILDGR